MEGGDLLQENEKFGKIKITFPKQRFLHFHSVFRVYYLRYFHKEEKSLCVIYKYTQCRNDSYQNVTKHLFQKIL